MLCDRPAVLNRNEAGRLHCEDGPAIAWRDGWALWHLNGVQVDEQIVLRPQTQTVEQIDLEQNQDNRSIRIERFGWPRYLKDSGSVCQHERKNEVEGTREALYRTPKGEQRLVVTCPTGRLFALGLPPEVKTCEEAQHWLGGGKNFNVIAST